MLGSVFKIKLRHFEHRICSCFQVNSYLLETNEQMYPQHLNPMYSIDRADYLFYNFYISMRTDPVAETLYFQFRFKHGTVNKAQYVNDQNYFYYVSFTERLARNYMEQFFLRICHGCLSDSLSFTEPKINYHLHISCTFFPILNEINSVDLHTYTD